MLPYFVVFLQQCHFPCICNSSSLNRSSGLINIWCGQCYYSVKEVSHLFWLLQDYLTNPVRIKVGKVSSPTANVSQTLEKVPENDKVCSLLNLNSKVNRLIHITFNGFDGTILLQAFFIFYIIQFFILLACFLYT